MKRFIFSLLALLLWQYGSAQSAQLLGNASFVDLGSITAKSEQPLYFKFLNTGDQPLVLTEPRTSFGYEVVYVPEKVVAGAIDSIGVVIDVNELKAHFAKPFPSFQRQIMASLCS
jgi:hypothetical protein